MAYWQGDNQWFIHKKSLEFIKIFQDDDGDFRIRVTMLSDNSTQEDITDHFANDDLDLGFHDDRVNSSAPNITLILILSAIFVILFISALLTCTRRKKESQVKRFTILETSNLPAC